MRLFKRAPKDQTIAELERYYSQYGTRSSTAWFMAIASLFATVIVLVGLFFGGRWLYRAVTDDGAQVATTQSEPDAQSPEEVDRPLSDYLPKDDDTTKQEGTVSNEAARTTEPNADRVAAATTTVPSTGASTLPATGSEVTVITALLLASIATGYIYQIKQQKS